MLKKLISARLKYRTWKKKMDKRESHIGFLKSG